MLHYYYASGTCTLSIGQYHKLRHPTQVINCGAGFDTTYLNLRNQSVIGPDCCSYFEVDFPAVALLKAAIVRGSKHAVSLCLNKGKKRDILADSRGNIRIGNYSVLGCDLTGAEFLLFCFSYFRYPERVQTHQKVQISLGNNSKID